MKERIFITKNKHKMELEDYLASKLERAGFCGLDIIKTPLVTRIVLHVAKPGLAIGKSGATIKELTEKIATEHKIDNPQIEIQEIKAPNLNATILSKKMASMIEGGFSWRSISYRMIKDIMSAGAQGVELVIKGKLSGKGGRKRKQRIAIGYLKKRGYQSRYVDKAKAAAYPKAGAIGITLSIIHPDVIFPDKIDVNEVIKNSRKVKEEIKEQKEEIEEKIKEEIEDEKEKAEEIVEEIKEKVEEVDDDVKDKLKHEDKEKKKDTKKNNEEKDKKETIKDKKSEKEHKQKEEKKDDKVKEEVKKE